MEVLKDLKEALSEKTTVSRRGFLKGLGVFSATAAIYGCGGGGQSSYSNAPAVGTAIASAADNLVIDPELQVTMVSEPWNCGGKCAFKIWSKNGVMVKISSGSADIPRATSAAADESINMPQFRGCPKGYAMIKKAYQPDRLQTPLKQTLSRGNMNGFVSITWDEAYDRIAAAYQTVIGRASVLGYLPLGAISGTGCNPGVAPYLGYPYLTPTGAPSTDNMVQAMYGAIGTAAASNGLGDLLNSKFILNIGANTTTSFSHQFPSHWYFTKAKEAGIPIVTMDPLFTDSAAVCSSGYSKFNLPAFINPRVGTDAAILAAMATYIYANNLHNVSFLKQYCFGFFPGDTVVSQSTTKNPVTGLANAGQTFTTPTGMSFVEYLTGLMTTYGGVSGVMNWASQISGVPAATIQNLALAYATTSPACLFGGYGGCRSAGAYHYTMMLIALAAMTGNSNIVGGGPGFVAAADPTPINLGATKNPVTTHSTVSTIGCSSNAFVNILLNGVDNRTPAQMRADILYQNKIDLGAWTTTRNDAAGHDGRLRIEMIEWGGNNMNSRRGTIAKLVQAIKNVNFIFAIDNHLNPSAVFSDIVLPVDSHLERYEFQSKPLVYYANNAVVNTMYQCKNMYNITGDILNRLGVQYGTYGPRGSETLEQIMAEQWAGATISSVLTAANPGATLPSFATFQQQGIFQLPLTPAQSVVGLAATVAGKYSTDTGRINFFSPFYFYRDQGLGSTYQKPDGGYYRSTYPPKAMFAPPVEGFNPTTGAFLGSYTGSKIMTKTGQPAVYSLQINTAHHRRRAHTVYDNVAMLKEDFPEVITMNPSDAAARGISNGDYVYVYNDHGCVKQNVMLSNRIAPGAVHIGDGEWYRPSPSETYQAWLDMAGTGVPTMYSVPVDVGGAPNTLMHDRDIGTKDIACGTAGDNCWNGHFVEVSLTHPDM